jgi:DNA-binding PadR family transcriptional regulator
MRRGDTRFALLSALVDGPGHGYELIQRLEDRTGGRWKPSPGSVYPTLQLLEETGLVRSEQRDDKRVYEITEAGQTALAGREPGGARGCRPTRAVAIGRCGLRSARHGVKQIGRATRVIASLTTSTTHGASVPVAAGPELLKCAGRTDPTRCRGDEVRPVRSARPDRRLAVPSCDRQRVYFAAGTLRWNGVPWSSVQAASQPES